MAIQQVASKGLGLSTGTVLIIAGIIIVGTIIYNNKKKNHIVNIEDLSNEQEKYETNKWIVEDAISKHDIEKLKRLLSNENIRKHSDLSQLIGDFLEKDNG